MDEAKAENPYAPYNTALQSVAPEQQMNNLVLKLQQLYLAPGWCVSHLQLKGGRYQAQMTAQGGNLELLSQWSQRNHYEFSVLPTGPLLTATSDLPSRSNPSHVIDLQTTVMRVVDRVNLILRSEQSVHVGATQHYGRAKQAQLNVEVTNISPGLLDLVGQELKQLPVVLSNVDITVSNGFISGTIQLSVWGS
jgi:hypothetical protein